MHEHTPAAAVRENEKTATFKSAGSYDEVVYCSVCKEEISRKTVSIPKLVHKDGWYDNNGTRYYYVGGKAVKGMQKIDGRTYYFDADGAMQTGWANIGGVRYHFSESGVLIS